jgi:catalase
MPKAREAGNGGETHQQTTGSEDALTTNQGVPIADNQNSLKGGSGGPTLLEDFILREKITHFDHERIPERIVHARGSGAHGFFQPYGSMADVTRAHFLSGADIRTPVFARFSTVAGGAGSVDLPRDVRGFAVKFYTQEGNFDLVGNNIPVFFIQDAMKFPDVVHAVKMEADRGYPQNASAHDTFWDFISLMPESMHMIMWIMSDRTIPRSLRMIEGFGVNTFRLINERGESRFVKFHWRPILGTSAVLWDEAVKICGADQDYHRRDLFEAIEKGHFPEFELGFQVFDQQQADRLEFDHRDATKLIPEEQIPLKPVGRMVLDRNPDNFFAETEQVAFCPSHVVPGIDFSDDPLLQGRLFSYLDTQLKRLGSTNFHQLPINRPKCPFANFQRDGHMQMLVPRGRANYEPNSLADPGPRETPDRGFNTFPSVVEGEKVRLRKESFADHYSQARMFYRSVTAPEQRHIREALAFELAKVETLKIRSRMLGHLNVIDEDLGSEVATALGMRGQADTIEPHAPVREIALSPAVRLYRYQPSLEGKSVGLLLGQGFDADILGQLENALLQENAIVAKIGTRIGGAVDADGEIHEVQKALAAAPSVLFDSVAVLGSVDYEYELRQDPDAVSFVMDAKRHLKALGWHRVPTLIDDADANGLEGIVEIDGAAIAEFIRFAKEPKIWSRELRRKGP